MILAFVLVVVITGLAAVGLALLAFLGLYARRDVPGILMRKPTDLIPLLTITVIALLAITIGLALVAASTVLRPVRLLAVAADRVARGELDIRLDVVGSDELSELTRSFNAMTGSLEATIADLRRLEARGRRFAGDVSHELRTPLAAMTAVAGILDDEAASLHGPAAAAARLVVRETRSLNRLVEDLIEISQFDAGAALMLTTEVDLVTAVHDCLRLRRLTGEVEVDLPPALITRVDPRRFEVVLANLVGNALRHGRPPVTLRLVTEHDAAGRWAVLQVGDHGPGIASDALPRVFDRFYKSDSSRARSEGSGLGLALAWENTQLHGGTISVANREGGGAEFTVRIPMGRDHADAAAADASVDASGHIIGYGESPES